MNFATRDTPRKTIRQPGIVCRHCEIPFSATSVLSDDGNFTCRILYCEQCKTIVDKNWWSMPKMMANTHAIKIKTVAEATEDWGDGSTILTRRKPLTTSKRSTTLKEATRFQEERSLVNQKFHGRKEPENADLHEEEEAELVPEPEKYVCHCSFCGEAGHNRRSCAELAGLNNTYQKEIDDLPTLQSCSVCGAQGHNKRTCKVGPLIIQPKDD